MRSTYYHSPEGLALVWRRADALLSPRNVSIWRRRREGQTLRALAKRERISYQRVQQIVREVAASIGLPAPCLPAGPPRRAGRTRARERRAA